MADVLQEGFEAQAKAMREFGYPDVTASTVAEAHRKWRAGEPMDNIIERFCEGAFDDHPQIFGQPD